MKRRETDRRWVFVVIIFLFLVFHQMDVQLLRPITIQMIHVLNSRDLWIEPIITVSVGVSIVFALIWGYLFDRRNRVRLLVITGFLWGVTSLLMGISPTLATYIISSAAGGIDNTAITGIVSMVGDFFSSRNRGKVIGLFHVSQPLALYMVIFISTALENTLYWRSLLITIGLLAFILSAIIIFLLKEPKRGQREVALAGMPMKSVYIFDWEVAKESLKNHSLQLIFAFSLFGTVPWFVLTAWLSRYLQDINQISPSVAAQNLIPALISLTIGYPAGGWLGDHLYQTSKIGRVVASILGTIFPMIFLFFALQMNGFENPFFVILLILMGFFMSFSWPNMIAALLETTVPEIRSFLVSVALVLQAIGGLLGPYLVSVLQPWVDLKWAILWVCVYSWLIGLFCQIGLFFTFPSEIERLRRHMAYRHFLESRLANSNLNRANKLPFRHKSSQR